MSNVYAIGYRRLKMKEEGTYGAERRTKGEGIEINFMYVPKKNLFPTCYSYV